MVARPDHLEPAPLSLFRANTRTCREPCVGEARNVTRASVQNRFAGVYWPAAWQNAQAADKALAVLILVRALASGDGHSTARGPARIPEGGRGCAARSPAGASEAAAARPGHALPLSCRAVGKCVSLCTLRWEEGSNHAAGIPTGGGRRHAGTAPSIPSASGLFWGMARQRCWPRCLAAMGNPRQVWGVVLLLPHPEASVSKQGGCPVSVWRQYMWQAAHTRAPPPPFTRPGQPNVRE